MVPTSQMLEPFASQMLEPFAGCTQYDTASFEINPGNSSDSSVSSETAVPSADASSCRLLSGVDG